MALELPETAGPLLRGTLASFDGNFDKAIDILSQASSMDGEEDDRPFILLRLALAQKHVGNQAAAHAALLEAEKGFVRRLTIVKQNTYAAAEAHSYLGMCYGALGNAADAIAEGEKGVAMQPSAEDPFAGPEREENLAQIYALLGNAEHAVPVLGRLLQLSYAGFYGCAITVPILRRDTLWDAIRNDPGFQQLVSGKESTGPNK